MDTPADRAADVLADSIAASALSAFARFLDCRVRDLDPMLCAAVQTDARRHVRRYLTKQPIGERDTPEVTQEEYTHRMWLPKGVV